MKNFNSRDELINYIYTSSNGLYRCIGKGSNSFCHLGNDNKTYKIFNVFEEKDLSIYRQPDLEHFIFPEEIYLVDNKLAGYKTKYIDNDILVSTKSLIMGENPKELDLSVLKKAYEEFIVEVDTLSRQGICLYDLIGNLLYDGENLYAIDTDDYERVDLDYDSLYKKNIEIVKQALIYELTNYYNSIKKQVPDLEELFSDSKRNNIML